MWCYTEEYDEEYFKNIELKCSPKPKCIYQIDLETNQIIKEFPSLSSASKEVNGHIGNISKCAKGEIKCAYGYKWKYA